MVTGYREDVNKFPNVGVSDPGPFVYFNPTKTQGAMTNVTAAS